MTIDIRDQASAALAALRAGVSPGAMNPAIGAGVVKLFQVWFRNNGTNKQGWPSTGFWADAARNTSWQLVPDGVLISAEKIGVRQRYQGGDIEPGPGKSFLTIPARAEAYGKRAGEFDNLVFAWHRKDGKSEPWGLVEASATKVKRGKKRKDGSQKTTTEEVGGLVMFWLVKSVHQDADPSVLPPDNLIGDTALAVVSDAVERALRKS